MSIEKFLAKSRRMRSNFSEILYGRLEDYKYSDANRVHMMEILRNPGNYTEEDKINTLLSFHKDTCANVRLLLDPFFGNDALHQEAVEDLKILKDFETVLSVLEIETQKRCLVAMYKHSRVKLRQLKMKAAMLESLQAKQLSEDIAEQLSEDILKKLQCDDDYAAEIYNNDTDRLLGVKTDIHNTLAKLQRLGVDESKYQDSDGDGDEVSQIMHDQPKRYMLLEEEVKRRFNEMVGVSEDVNPIAGYISDLKYHTEIMEKDLTASNAHRKLVEKIQGTLKGGCSAEEFTSLLGSLKGDSSSPQYVMNALIDALFGGGHKVFSKEVKKMKNCLSAATHDDEESQILLLRAIECFCENSGREVVKDIASVLKTLYDGKVLEGENIVQWYNEGVAASGSENSQIWKNVKPMIEWFQSAESESD